MEEFNQILDYPCCIETYKRSRLRLSQYEPRSELEMTRVNAMISNCDYIISWLETGRRPGNRRGVERLAAYQREIPTDIIEKYVKPPEPLKMVSDTDYARVEYILSLLSDRERECYEMSVGGQLSEHEIARLLGIKRSSVQEFIRRANDKVKKYRNMPTPLFLLDITA